MKPKTKPKVSTPKIIFYLTIIILITISATLYILSNNTTSIPSPITQPQITNNTVTRVIDGDTLVLKNGNRIRLLCIDAPELGTPGSQQSKNFLENLVLGKEIRLEKDITDKDKYDRLLRYVYITTPEKEIFINKELVQQNQAKVWRYGNDTSKCDEIAR